MRLHDMVAPIPQLSTSDAGLLLSAFGPALKTRAVRCAPLDANRLIGRKCLAKIAELVQGSVGATFGIVTINELVLGSGVAGRAAIRHLNARTRITETPNNPAQTSKFTGRFSQTRLAEVRLSSLGSDSSTHEF